MGALYKAQFATLEQFQLHRSFVRDGSRARYHLTQGAHTIVVFYRKDEWFFLVQYHEESGVTLYVHTEECRSYCEKMIKAKGYNV